MSETEKRGEEEVRGASGPVGTALVPMSSERTTSITREDAKGGPTEVDRARLRERLEGLAELAEQLAEAQHSANTQRAYKHDVDVFAAWCVKHGASPLPATAAIVRAFVTAEFDGGKSMAVIMRRVAAITHHHRKNGELSPLHAVDSGPLRATLAGMRRTHAGRVKRKKRAADARVMRAMIDTITGDRLRALRDRAVLAIGMAAALRRSELVALSAEDVELVPEGLRLTIRSSKTDGTGEGHVVAVPEGSNIRPMAHLLAWVDASGILEEDRRARDTITGRAWSPRPLFRRLTPKDLVTPHGMSDKTVERIVKRAAAAAGYDPAEFAGHSLRAGFLTESAATGATIFKMQEVSRHKSVQVLSEYVRDADRFKNHAGAGFL